MVGKMVGRIELAAIDSHKIKVLSILLADGVGFEPTVGVNPRRFSRPVP